MLLIAVSPAKETTPAHSGGQKTAKTGDEKLHLDRPVYATALYGSSSSRPLDAEVGHLLQEIKRCRQAGLPDPEMPIHPDDIHINVYTGEIRYVTLFGPRDEPPPDLNSP
jgi:hypothetical protein